MNVLRNAGFGLLLLMAAFAMLFWAEGRAVKTARALDEGAGLVVEVNPTSVDSANDGKLVHISGTLTPLDTPTDIAFGTMAKGATLLKRKVEMFQWVEVKETVEADGQKTERVRYDKKWSDKPIDSTKFVAGDFRINGPMPFESDSFMLGEGKIEAFRLTGSDLAGLGKTSTLVLTEAEAQMFGTKLGSGKPVKILDNAIVHSFSPTSPVIGDLRISYQQVLVDKLSAVGRQQGDRLVPFEASNGNTVFLFEDGILPAAQMFDRAQASNTALTWGLRVLGVVLMFIGSKLIFSILTGIADFIPLLGSIVRAGTTLASIAISLFLASIAVAAGWIFYRPLLAVVVLGVGIAVAVSVAVVGRRNPAPNPATAKA
jgi:Transmembrane protein 43